MIVFRPHTDCVNVVAFSPDGRRLASVGEDGWVKLWDTAAIPAGEPVWAVEGHLGGGSNAQFTPNGRLLLTCGSDARVRVWDVAKRKERYRLQRPTPSAGGVGALVLSRDGRFVAFAGGWFGRREPLARHERIAVVSTADWTTLRSFAGHDGAIEVLAAGPDGLASGSADRRIKFWDWDTGRCYHRMPVRGYVRGLTFSPDGSRLAASAGTILQVWEMTRPGRRKHAMPGRMTQLRGHTRAVMCLDFSPDGRLLASSSEDGTVRLWDVAAGSECRVFAPKLGPLHWVAFAPDGLTLAFTSNAGDIGVLDLGD